MKWDAQARPSGSGFAARRSADSPNSGIGCHLSPGSRLLARVIAAGLALSATAAAAQVADTTLWATDGPVHALVRDGNTIYIGGQFAVVGPTTGGGALLGVSSGELVGPTLKVHGVVSATVPDGSGGWFIGGSFRRVGGQPRSNLAHILANGSVANWNPDPNGQVNALAISGNTIYAGGWFGIIGGEARNGIAALDATTGTATAWDPSPGAAVIALAVDGATVYAGGYFSSIGGQARRCIAALDAASGTATAWDPGANYCVRALAVSGNTVYAGGEFTSVGGRARNHVAALDVDSGTATDWDPDADNWVEALAVSGGTVYAGGDFAQIGGQWRSRIAALDAATGAVTDWDPHADADRLCVVQALAVSGNTVYAGGEFTSIGGQGRNCIAALDALTGTATAWDPHAFGLDDFKVLALAVSGGTVYAGGSFTSIGGHARSCIAALDATIKTVTAWDPHVEGDSQRVVETLAVSGSTVYAGGVFAGIGGQARADIAALDLTTGTATAWDPRANGVVDALAVNGSTIYVGGGFTSIGGQVRNHIAALDAMTGAATVWDPNADNWVYALAVDGNTVYAGGVFSSIGGQVRSCIAALDATSGTATAWDPHANGGFSHSVHALAVSGARVYAGGYFTTIGRQTRNHIAALDAATGDATFWDPVASDQVEVLVVAGNIVYAGGYFTSIGGQVRSCVAALDAASGTVTRWNPNAVGYPACVRGLAVSGSTVYAGGTFQRIGGQPQINFAGMPDSPTGTLFARFDAEVRTEGVLLRWSFHNSLSAGAVAVARAEHETGPWTRLSIEPHDEGGLTLVLDRSAEPGRTYWYRLSVTLGDGTSMTFGPIQAELPGRIAASGLVRLAPNPSSGNTRVEYVVARPEKVRLSVVDVAGREVDVLADADLEPGRYSVVWDGHRQRESLPAGLYFVRWQSPGRSMQKRIVLVR